MNVPRPRLPRFAMLVTLPLLVAACGGSGDPSGIAAPKLAANWAKVTGDPLATQERSAAWTLLKVPESRDRYEQYGVFSLYVVKTKQGKEILLHGLGGEEIAPERGIRWQQDKDTRSFSATKVYGDNVIVRWQAGERRRLDAGFRRLDRTVAAAIAGDPELLPAEDRTCASQRIDAETGTMQGSCRLGGVQLTIVNARTRLTTRPLAARLTSVRAVAEIPSLSRYGTADTAKGRFVVVSYTLENRGRAAIDDLATSIAVGGRLYAQSTRSDVDLYGSAGDPFPVQPGATVTIRDAFDVPAGVAARAVRRGALVLPTGTYPGTDSLTAKVAQGRIRLAGAPSREPGGPSLVTTPAQRARARAERHVETTLRRLFAAVRRSDAPALCALLTRQAVLARGGLDRCRSAAAVKSSAGRLVPRRGRPVRFTTFVARGARRATVFATSARFRAFYGLVAQGGRWRVSTYKRLR